MGPLSAARVQRVQHPFYCVPSKKGEGGTRYQRGQATAWQGAEGSKGGGLPIGR